MPAEEQCNEWWPGGLKWHIFHRCDRQTNHTSWHLNRKASMKWSGKLTERERELVPA